MKVDQRQFRMYGYNWIETTIDGRFVEIEPSGDLGDNVIITHEIGKRMWHVERFKGYARHGVMGTWDSREQTRQAAMRKARNYIKSVYARPKSCSATLP